jgi:hypothetical protein
MGTLFRHFLLTVLAAAALLAAGCGGAPSSDTAGPVAPR